MEAKEIIVIMAYVAVIFILAYVAYVNISQVLKVYRGLARQVRVAGIIIYIMIILTSASAVAAAMVGAGGIIKLLAYTSPVMMIYVVIFYLGWVWKNWKNI